MIADNDVIRVKNARTHNLKNVSIEIPKNKLVVVTGLSGSGKSSLAVDTIFAEGQRQYIESLSLYARQFFDQGFATEVESIEGLQPTICIDQRRGSTNPRSTIATLTEIYDFLRLLFAKLGQIRCPKCNSPVAPQTIQQIGESVLSLPERTKVMILAPMVSERKGQHKEVFETIRKERLVRARVDGELYDIDELPDLDPKHKHDIEAVADRIIVKEGIRDRLFESIEMATKLSGGALLVCHNASESGNWSELLFSTKNACPTCGESCPHVTTRTFSFSSPYGACESCHGLGKKNSFVFEMICPEPKLPIRDSIAVWNCLPTKIKDKHINSLVPVLTDTGACLDTSLSDLSPDQLRVFMESQDPKKPGLFALIEKEIATTLDEDRADWLESARGNVDCSHCDGRRLNRFARSVFVNDLDITSVCNLPLADAKEWLDRLFFDGNSKLIAEPIVAEIASRLKFLLDVGLEYLTLDRRSDSLSGGELQRVRLGKSIGNGLTGACYVLDEPSIGLHSNDNQRLIQSLLALKEAGNTLVVVEHNEEIMRAADRIVDVGPGAGTHGGRIVFNGTYEETLNSECLTGDYLSGRKTIELGGNSAFENSNLGPSSAPDPNAGSGKKSVDRPKVNSNHHTECISLRNASGFNLKGVDLDLPLSQFTCITGVSGSGKSSLIYKTLAPAVREYFELVGPSAEPYSSIGGLEFVDRFVEIDQRPISKTPRGCAATYTGLFDEIRKLFAATKQAKQLGFTSSRFSFNTKKGWCPECEGHGVRRIKMKFMPDVFADCGQCQGARFNRSTLGIRFAGMSIAEVLRLSIDEASEAFKNISRMARTLTCLKQVGLGYLTLGQPSTSLSGGEAQRIKLATELSKRSTGRTLYLMDEPTTGLHFHDIQMLLNVIGNLVSEGNTFVVIEHDLDFIKCADWVVDMGPGAGSNGGEIVAFGTPSEVAKLPQSLTGQQLAAKSFDTP